VRAAPPPSSQPRPAQFGDAAEALDAVRVLLETATDRDDQMPLPDQLVVQARQFFRMRQSMLLMATGAGRKPRVSAVDGTAARSLRGVVSVEGVDPLAEVAGSSDGAVVRVGPEAQEVASSLGLTEQVGTLLLLPIRGRKLMNYVLLLADARPLQVSGRQLDAAESFAAAVGAGLSRFQLARAHAFETSRRAALSEAAKNVNSSLDLNRVLVRICEEAARILDADMAVVYLGDGREGLRMEAGAGVRPELIGLRLEPGNGLAGRVAQQDTPMLTNHYQSLTTRAPVHADLRHAMAVPMHWNSELHGVLALGWTRFSTLRPKDLDLLAAFGEIAATACHNASEHEGLLTTARTDALTGCLNRAALHEALRIELDRCARTGQNLSLVILDLDDFKQVNERHGHLAGDEVLRRVGRALRGAVRPYDIVGRYGGDEFALVAVEADEPEGCEMAARAIERVSASRDDLGGAGGCHLATAGVAQWRPGESPTELIDRADRALLHGKQRGARGEAVRASAVLPDQLSAA
jgi:diguanylate cyclase (GGDEF)-like protein